MKRLLCAGLLWAGAGIAGGAETPANILDKANTAYAAGDFASARDGYIALLNQGYGDSGLKFNLGNAHYRLGQIGLARLWYERALAANPGDEDARYNRDLIQRRIDEKERPGDYLESYVTVLWIATAVLNAVFFGCLILGLFGAGEILWWSRWVTGILFGLALAGSIALQRHASQPYGVMVDQRVEARTGPSAGEQVGFLLPEAQRVALFETINGWNQIGLPDKGLKGWVPADTVTPIRSPVLPAQ